MSKDHCKVSAVVLVGRCLWGTPREGSSGKPPWDIRGQRAPGRYLESFLWERGRHAPCGRGPGFSSGDTEAWSPQGARVQDSCPLSHIEDAFLLSKSHSQVLPRLLGSLGMWFLLGWAAIVFSLAVNLNGTLSSVLSPGSLVTQANSHCRLGSPITCYRGNSRVLCPNGPGLPKSVVYFISIWGSFLYV